MTETFYIPNHQGFRQFLAGQWFAAAYPDADNLSFDPNNVERLADPGHETLTVEWFRYMHRQIGAAWTLNYWPGANEADKALMHNLQITYDSMKSAAEMQGYQFDAHGNITVAAE